jgi:hypothetical protein
MELRLRQDIHIDRNASIEFLANSKFVEQAGRLQLARPPTTKLRRPELIIANCPVAKFADD